MRIIHASCVAPPEIGGIGRVASKEVASLVERGHDAHLVSLTSHAGFRLGHAGSIHALEHFVRDADVVHLHYPFYGTAGHVARLRRKGVITHLVMTLHMDAIAKGVKGALFDLHRKWFQAKELDAADALLVSSIDYAERSSYAGVAARAIELPFGVDEKVFSPGSSERSRFGLLEEQPVVIFVGGMDRPHAFKGIDVLLRAMAFVPDAQLLLVGEGDMRPDYEGLTASLGISDRIRFAGKLDDELLIAAYRSSDLLVLPSTSMAEAFGLVVLEAQACGVPVLASDLPGVRTVVNPEVTGGLVPPGDEIALAREIKRLLFEGSTLAHMASLARQRVLERFTWTRHMDDLTDVYTKICASRS